MRSPVLIALGLHALLALAAATFGHRLGRWSFWLCATAPAATVAWALREAPAVLAGQPAVDRLGWAPSIGLDVAFRVDGLALLMVGLVSGIGTLIFVYAFFYFNYPRADIGRFAAILTAFAGSMLGLVTVDNLLALFVFWELTSITSYLLIGFEHVRESARAAALQALLITGAGGLALLAGLILIGQAAGTWSLTEVLADPPTGALMTAAALCVLAGAMTKSAQAPFHSWLPAAMAAPTPVSAYLHSATMVKAGVYLAARLAPMLVVATSLWRPLAVSAGVITMLVGGYRALRQHDLKQLLAYGTVSQLGLMFALFSLGTKEGAFAGAALLVAHGVFKAALFMVVGVIDHATGTRDLRILSGLRRQLPGVAVVAGIAAASMAGIPPLAGFIAKEGALDAFVAGPASALAPLWLAGVVLASVLTVAYSFRFWWGAFGDKPAVEARHVHGPAVGFWAPAALLAFLAVVFGVAPALETDVVEAATVAIHPEAHPHALALWHGFGLPLALSAVALAGGAVLAVGRHRVERIQDAVPTLPRASAVYAGSLSGLVRLASRVTAIVQPGSLPVYLAVILSVLVLLPTARLLGAPLTGWQPARLADSPLQVAAVGIAVAGAFGVALARRRFAAVLALGVVGYSTVTIFALHGAPDLALTQLLIETLTVVVFVLTLRYLPERFQVIRWRLGQGVRWIVSVAVGVFVAAFGLIAGGARTRPTVSEEFIARAPEAGGHNIVNVVLVDFRGLDTLGEITVLAVAGLGIAALVLAPRRRAADADAEAQASEPDRAVEHAGPRTRRRP